MRVNGHPLTCGHCGGTSFQQGRAQLNTAAMTFFELDWLNKSADTFICKDCGHIEWFLEARVEKDLQVKGHDCANCGYFVSQSVAVCPNCGRPA